MSAVGGPDPIEQFINSLPPKMKAALAPLSAQGIDAVAKAALSLTPSADEVQLFQTSLSDLYKMLELRAAYVKSTPTELLLEHAIDTVLHGGDLRRAEFILDLAGTYFSKLPRDEQLRLEQKGKDAETVLATAKDAPLGVAQYFSDQVTAAFQAGDLKKAKLAFKNLKHVVLSENFPDPKTGKTLLQQAQCYVGALLFGTLPIQMVKGVASFSASTIDEIIDQTMMLKPTTPEERAAYNNILKEMWKLHSPLKVGLKPKNNLSIVVPTQNVNPIQVTSPEYSPGSDRSTTPSPTPPTTPLMTATPPLTPLPATPPSASPPRMRTPSPELPASPPRLMPSPQPVKEPTEKEQVESIKFWCAQARDASINQRSPHLAESYFKKAEELADTLPAELKRIQKLRINTERGGVDRTLRDERQYQAKELEGLKKYYESARKKATTAETIRGYQIGANAYYHSITLPEFKEEADKIMNAFFKLKPTS